MPSKFDYKAETGKSSKVHQAKDGTWRETVKFYDGDKIVSMVNAIDSQDGFTEWLSRKHSAGTTLVKFRRCRVKKG